MHGGTAVVGIGATEFSQASGRSELQLAAEAIRAALEDAGLAPSDVDGLTTYTVDNNDEVDVVRSVGLGNVRFMSRIPYGGGGPCATVHHAAMAVATGSADVVVCYRALNERSGARFGAGTYYRPITSSVDVLRFSMYMPYGLITPASWIAMTARRWMHETGATSEDLGRVSVTMRAHAATNPAARFFERPITLEDHQSSRWIVEPLRLYDCCLESDGAVALIVTSLERARSLKNVPAVIVGSAQAMPSDQESMTSYYGRDMSFFPESRQVRDEIWAQTKLGPADIQAAVLYDHFTPAVLMQLEDWGFCERGESGAFVEDGNISLSGTLPVNTHGGQIGEAYIHGMNGIAEGVRLVRGTSANQVADVENVLVTGGPGVPTSALVVARQ
jgi:acetyl-CoA acetyltransferase